MSGLLNASEIERGLVATGVPPEKARARALELVGRPSPANATEPFNLPVHTPRAEPEHDEQVTLFAWAALMESQYPELRWLFAVPNWIGTRTRHHGAYLKAEGRKPGVPDLWLPVSRQHYHGLVIEMKVKPNRPSDEQRAWLAHLEQADYAVHVCYSAIEAQGVILAYLDPPSDSPRRAV